jgi:hypothetical protein
MSWAAPFAVANRTTGRDSGRVACGKHAYGLGTQLTFLLCPPLQYVASIGRDGVRRLLVALRLQEKKLVRDVACITSRQDRPPANRLLAVWSVAQAISSALPMLANPDARGAIRRNGQVTHN